MRECIFAIHTPEEFIRWDTYIIIVAKWNIFTYLYIGSKLQLLICFTLLASYVFALKPWLLRVPVNYKL